MQQPHANTDGDGNNKKRDDDFIPRLMAIVESDRPQHERLDNALKLCVTHAANIKAKHGLFEGGRPTREGVARIRRELGALHDEMIRRETVYPDFSITQNVLRASIRAIDCERNWDPAADRGTSRT